MAAIFLSAAALILTARTIRTEAYSSPIASSCVTSADAAVPKQMGKRLREFQSFDPTIHLTRLVVSEDQRYEGSGRNIFRAWVDGPLKKIEETKTPPQPLEQVAIERLSLMFYGFTNMPNHPRRVFIRDEDALFIASEGDIVDRRYRIDKIGADSVDVEDLIEHRAHTLMLTGLAETK